MPAIPPSAAPLSKKLHLKPNYKVLLLNAPAGYADLLNPLPEGATVSTRSTKRDAFDLALLFVHSKSDADRHAPLATAALKDGGVLWAAYPKISSKEKSDVTRDKGWNALESLAWTVVSIVAIDQTWSALRFGPSTKVGS